MERSLLEQIDRARKKAGASRSALIRQALNAWLAEQDRVAAEARERAIVRRHRVQLRREAQELLDEQASP